jgi:hypothetical protein
MLMLAIEQSVVVPVQLVYMEGMQLRNHRFLTKTGRLDLPLQSSSKIGHRMNREKFFGVMNHFIRSLP